MNRAFAGAILAGCALAPGPALAQSKYHVHTEWRELKVGIDVCKQKAETALETSSFVVEGRNLLQSRYGRRANFVAAIRCVPEKEVVFFLISGPDWEKANTYFDQVLANFK